MLARVWLETAAHALGSQSLPERSLNEVLAQVCRDLGLILWTFTKNLVIVYKDSPTPSLIPDMIGETGPEPSFVST